MRPVWPPDMPKTYSMPASASTRPTSTRDGSSSVSIRSIAISDPPLEPRKLAARSTGTQRSSAPSCFLRWHSIWLPGEGRIQLMIHCSGATDEIPASARACREDLPMPSTPTIRLRRVPLYAVPVPVFRRRRRRARLPHRAGAVCAAAAAGPGLRCRRGPPRPRSAARRPRSAPANCARRRSSPRPGFIAFNRHYVERLATWGTFRDEVNPVARSNVCPGDRPAGGAVALRLQLHRARARAAVLSPPAAARRVRARAATPSGSSGSATIARRHARQGALRPRRDGGAHGRARPRLGRRRPRRSSTRSSTSTPFLADEFVAAAPWPAA